MQIRQVIDYAQKKLSTTSGLEARILLSHTLNTSIESLLSNYYTTISVDVYNKFLLLLERRLNFEPISYIIGYKEFFGRQFSVNNHVLIPRQDSETLIEAVLKDFNRQDTLKILDLGVGSGCLLITLLCELVLSYGVGVDISYAALEVSFLNASNYTVSSRIELLLGNLFDNLTTERKFDIIISNPPYIAYDQIHWMSKETLLYEPHIALFAKMNGLEYFYKIAMHAKSFLKDNGYIYLEIGHTQLEQIITMFKLQGYNLIKVYKDLSKYNRCCCFSY